MSRFEEVVNEAIGEVVLGEAAFRAETLAQHIAENVRDRQEARRAEVTIARALSRAQARSGQRHPDPGDLHAVRLGGRVRARHAPARRRRGAGHDGLPVRAEARRGQRPGGPRRRRLRRERDRADRRHRPDRDPQPAWSRHAAHRLPGGLRHGRSRRRRCSQIVEGSMSSEIYELMKRTDEGRRRREGTPPPALRRGLRARDGARGRSTASRDLGDDAFRRARQENLETIHQHNVVAERFGLLGELRRELASGRALRAPRHARASGSTAAPDQPSSVRAARPCDARVRRRPKK